ncbi:MAG: hypothetical protein DSM106950_30825 [Stigonema ocellatum SAG 48.90 = DSM 106950]|nr:hypothetical protein [Stigonema ocellatum SAG 48.90 = DSM 106950]
MKYNRTEVRKLLEALTKQEFDKSLDDFSNVRQQFTDGQTQYDRFNIVLDYFEKHQGEEFSSFLKAIEECNSSAYDKYSSQLVDSDFSEKFSNLKSDRKLIDELEKILPKNDELFWKCAKNVYQYLLQLEDELEDEPKDLDELLKELEDRTEQLVILDFIPRLIAYMSINYKQKNGRAIRNDLEKWTKDNLLKFKVNESDFQKALAQFKNEYQSGTVYLLVEIQKSKSYPNLFTIFGWLATDKRIQAPELGLISLNAKYPDIRLNDTQDQEKHYTIENLKQIIRDFILVEIPKSQPKIKKLIIEFFLPSSLLGWEVDQWELEPPNRILLGSVHEVRIRSLDRLSLKYKLYREKWKNKWRAVQQCETPLQQFFPSHFNGDVNTLSGHLQNKQIVGLKLASALKSGHEDIALALYYSGTPIALWYRCEPLEGDCETQLNNLLQDRLSQLPERVYEERCQPERHISLIWDNPNLLIPNYQLQ